MGALDKIMYRGGVNIKRLILLVFRVSRLNVKRRKEIKEDRCQTKDLSDLCLSKNRRWMNIIIITF